ncbi:hypothetical protein QL285_084500 [Trifolium repens]|nr:hypothetical protein QL285_084500 [Trifolium repens]
MIKRWCLDCSSLRDSPHVHGANQFQIIPTMEEINPSKFPTWHSKSRGFRKAVAFEMKITDDPELISYLTLPQNM